MRCIAIALSIGLLFPTGVFGKESASGWEEDEPIPAPSPTPEREPIGLPQLGAQGSIYPGLPAGYVPAGLNSADPILPLNGDSILAPGTSPPTRIFKKQNWLQRTTARTKEFITAPQTIQNVAAGAIGIGALLLLIKMGKTTNPDIVYVDPVIDQSTGIVLRKGYWRTKANGVIWDNFSTQGNINPFTGKPGTVQP